MSGQDKFTGGITIAYSQKPGFVDEFIQHRAKASAMPNIVGDFVELLMLTGTQLEFNGISRDNNLRLKKQINALHSSQESPFGAHFQPVVTDDTGITLTGIRINKPIKLEDSFYENLATIAKDLMVVQARKMGLRHFSKRMSFAFMHPNVSTCIDVLRMETGLSKSKDMGIMTSLLHHMACNIAEIWRNQTTVPVLRELGPLGNFKELSDKYYRRHELRSLEDTSSLSTSIEEMGNEVFVEKFQQAQELQKYFALVNTGGEINLVVHESLLEYLEDTIGLTEEEAQKVFDGLSNVIRVYLKSIFGGSASSKSISSSKDEDEEPGIKLLENPSVTATKSAELLACLSDISKSFRSQLNEVLAEIVFNDLRMDEILEKFSSDSEESKGEKTHFSTWALSRHGGHVKKRSKKVTRSLEYGEPSVKSSRGRGRGRGGVHVATRGDRGGRGGVHVATRGDRGGRGGVHVATRGNRGGRGRGANSGSDKGAN